jgi:APA family basic amino acid/polyamine antiporter
MYLALDRAGPARSCAGVMATLPRLAWVGFIFWLVIGVAVYALYGATRSHLQRVTVT